MYLRASNLRAWSGKCQSLVGKGLVTFHHDKEARLRCTCLCLFVELFHILGKMKQPVSFKAGGGGGGHSNI